MPAANLLRKPSSVFATCWNGVHYSLFIWLRCTLNAAKRVDPIGWILRIPFVRAFYRRHGIEDISEYLDQRVLAVNDEKSGLAVSSAGSTMGLLVALVIWSALNVVLGLQDKSLFQIIGPHRLSTLLCFVLIVTAAGLFNYLALFRHHQYRTYFRRFEALDRNSRIRIHFISALVILFILAVFAFSLGFLPELHAKMTSGHGHGPMMAFE